MTIQNAVNSIYTTAKLLAIVVTLLYETTPCNGVLHVYILVYGLIEACSLLGVILETLQKYLSEAQEQFEVQVWYGYLKVVLSLLLTSELVKQDTCRGTSEELLTVGLLLGLFLPRLLLKLVPKPAETTSQIELQRFLKETHGETCAICREDCTASGVVLECRHCFHFECMETWVSIKSICPTCRSSVN